MKILIVGFTKLKFMPYLRFYIDNLNASNFTIHLITWNRDLKEDEIIVDNIHIHEFREYQLDEVPKYKKIMNFIKFRKFSINKMKNLDFDKLIILHTLPGVILFDQLLFYYRKKYILDYRDFTFENYSIYRLIINILINFSYATFLSSIEFKKNLTKSKDYVISHNLLLDSLNYRSEFKINRKLPIRIGFWGFIRQYNLNKIFIEKISLDSRFELHYFGREQKTALDLKKFVLECNAKNIFFHGEYSPKDRYIFKDKIDIIHNCYIDDKIMKNAVSNKFYDGIIFSIPQICYPNTFMSKLVCDARVGIQSSPFSDKFLDDIYNYYININTTEFNKNCTLKLNEVLNEYNNAIKTIDTFLK